MPRAGYGNAVAERNGAAFVVNGDRRGIVPEHHPHLVFVTAAAAVLRPRQVDGRGWAQGRRPYPSFDGPRVAAGEGGRRDAVGQDALRCAAEEHGLFAEKTVGEGGACVPRQRREVPAQRSAVRPLRDGVAVVPGQRLGGNVDQQCSGRSQSLRHPRQRAQQRNRGRHDDSHGEAPCVAKKCHPNLSLPGKTEDRFAFE